MRKKLLKPRYKQAFMEVVNVIKNDKNGKNSQKFVNDKFCHSTCERVSVAPEPLQPDAAPVRVYHF